MNTEEKKDAFVFVCFTCKRDESLLPVHYAAIQAACPGAPVWYFVDYHDKEMTVPENAVKKITTWNRRGNLRGADALHGIISSLILAGESTGRTPVKIDSDIYFINNEWILPVHNGFLEMTGFMPRGWVCASGACYCVTTNCLKRIKELLETISYIDRNNDRPEDETISMFAAIVSPPLKVIFYQNYYPDEQLVFSCVFQSEFMNQNNHDLAAVVGYIDCGDRKTIASLSRIGIPAGSEKLAAMKHCHAFYSELRKCL